MFITSIVLAIIALIALAFRFVADKDDRTFISAVSGAFAACAAVAFAFSMFTTVSASKLGVVTTFGKVSQEVLTEGAHFVAPWQRVHEVYTGMDVAAAEKSQAASRDLQSVHSDLTVNFHVNADKARELYQLNPGLLYKDAFVVPAMHEVFKAIIARYTAEELVTKRQEVSASITDALNARLAQYHLSAQTVNLVNFGFSQAFDKAIEEKVTASQKAETAKRNLERVKFEGESRIAQATAEAQAIAIQAKAITSQGGAEYVQLQAIAKWDGKLPATNAGGTIPFINIGKP